MKFKRFTLIGDAMASIVGGVASYFFYHPIVPIAFSGLGLVSVSIVSALFVFYVFRKNVAPMFKEREIPHEHLGMYINALFAFYLFEVVVVVGVTFFALIGTFFGFLFWKYLIVPYLPAIAWEKFFHTWL